LSKVHATGSYIGAGRTLDGDLYIKLVLDTERVLDELTDKRLLIDISEYKEKKSLEANAYFWVLCTKIAETLNIDKWTAYLMELRKYGQGVQLTVIKESLDTLTNVFRHIDIMAEYDDWVLNEDTGAYRKINKAEIIGWYGIHLYNTDEMSKLIDGTVSDAKELGIETLTPDEISRIESSWKGSGNETH